jgi:hypothetical protein
MAHVLRVFFDPAMTTTCDLLRCPSDRLIRLTPFPLASLSSWLNK